MSEAQRQAFVEDLLGMLELDGIADRVIGEDSSNGLLMGERKRVTIGKPSALQASRQAGRQAVVD